MLGGQVRATAAAGALAALAACATTTETETERDAEAFARDREAILAMTGDYDVTFHFEELVALAPDYALRPVKDSGGQETVFVLEDSGDVIRLQHVLAVGPEDAPIVVKHWRQDWVYEPARVLEYAGLERWATRDVPEAERAGSWSQTVYQVDDSPRYAGVAKWRHADGVSTWESPVIWRPLARREATTRDDYNVMQVVNRHTITPWGWAHEQDNEKIVLGPDGSTRALVREAGVNSYRKTDDFPHASVDAYWARTADFWAAVRDRWDAWEAEAATIDVAGKEPENPIYDPILDIVSDLEDGAISTEDALARTDAIYTERVTLDAGPRLAEADDVRDFAEADY